MASRYTSAAYAYDCTAQEQASYGYGAERRRRAAETRAPRFDVYTGAGRQADQDVSPAFLHVVKVFAVLAVLFCAIGLGRVTIASATTALLNDNAQISQEIEEVREAGENLEVMNSVYGADSRIRDIATGSLGMVEPDQRVILDFSSDASAAAGAEEASAE